MMPEKLSIVIAQINLKVGDIAHNLQKHIEAATTAKNECNADIIVFPELSLIGYPADDLLLRPSFLKEAEEALQQLAAATPFIYCLASHPHQTPHGLYNACSLTNSGKIIGRYAKQELPNYGVFDEHRYFKAGDANFVVNINNIPVGIVICEDLWKIGPVPRAVEQGARLILSPNASPFEIDKHEQRLTTLTERIKANNVPIFYVNCIGGQDDLIFDGGSMALDATGKLVARAGFFKEELLCFEVNASNEQTSNANKHPLSLTYVKSLAWPTNDEPSASINDMNPHYDESAEARTYQALVLALRDYVNKNHFPGVLIGVSGGIDSALTLALAVDALGAEQVKGIIMPSTFTSELSMHEAHTVINNLNVKHEVISIEASNDAFLKSLAPIFTDNEADITAQNIQARCRGVLLMAISNKTGWLVLTTSNRSEVAVGYCTLYGDMVGGFAVLKDIPKTFVYRLAQYRNSLSPVIPTATIERAPTAELAPNQKDQDSLPPYNVLDDILKLYINKQHSIAEIVERGFEQAIVEKVVKLVKVNEYKRRQAAIGPRITPTSFTRDRRYPITNGWNG